MRQSLNAVAVLMRKSTTDSWRVDEGSVAKILGEYSGREVSPLLPSLGDHSKQASDEGGLTWAISFVHSLHLSFPDHVHDLISL